ncbi:hypothetical protein NLI96_g2013 [Meripilus lineatus]|uniref:Pali-domain-containing protein n=1 Tax=Meripilus lineatus TaxID=2056292 RepID=A0AAD5V9J3_9APHY|nr:hypothetical protein NLI96_g2013 [Physisporinus lineatus]
MNLLRPATPGFLVTLTATILLAVVTFSVPYFKTVYFLQASLQTEGIDGSITFGTLGYCLHLKSNGTTCSKPSIGYELDINKLVGNSLPVEIPNVVVKWLTYALFLHAVALILAAGSAVFGLLAHVREFSMTCCSTCISGFAAVVAMVAFIFDLVLFFVAKARINSIDGGSASIGIGIWLTLAAWLLLFFAGCFYGFGRCCISRRPRGSDRNRDKPKVQDDYADQMRLDAVKAEADRKARQKQGEVGLPAFHEYEQRQPLTKADPEEYAEDGDHIVPLSSIRNGSTSAGNAYNRSGAYPPARQGSGTTGGYAQAPPGSRAVDDYYNRPSQNSYPPRRQMSAHTQDSSSASTYSYRPPLSPPPVPVPTAPTTGSQFLAVGAQSGHGQYPTSTSQNLAGHQAGGTSYHSAVSQHQQYPSAYSQFADPYTAPQQQQADYYDPYNASGFATQPAGASTGAYHSADPNPYFAQSTYPQHAATPPPQQQPDRSYTLGGDGYGGNVYSDYPAQSAYDAAYYGHYATTTTSSPSPAPPTPMPKHTAVSPPPEPQAVATPKGPRPPAEPVYEDSPPVYDVATAQPPGQWGAKH